ncbi:Protein of unknown function [Pyronema omphalodes CBS 100304]|uniref:Uncharacterized protein n=1 Tax=Pyronema omphalodes (strain CBS 100304) TaxID=1076935 RepID=U4L2R2_PYROM|nr:Protein of unknown function [Pyronema omphalodes CBS 100304]
MAAQAGALCIVVRSHDWYPAPIGVQSTDGTAFVGTMEGAERPDDTRPPVQARLKVENPRWFSTKGFAWFSWDTDYKNPVNVGRKVHGGYKLPPVYILQSLPSNAAVTPIPEAR